MALEGLPLLHWGWLGLGTAVSQRHSLSPPLPQLPLIKCGHIGHRRKVKGEQKQVVAHSAERHHSGNLLPLAEVPMGKNKGICGRTEEGKKEERQTGALTEDRGRHSKKISIK